MTRRAAAAAALAALFLAALPARGGAEASADGSCQRRTVAVSLSPNGAADSFVAAWLCRPTVARTDAVQVLVSGTTYDHRYWDFPFRPDRYSYVAAALQAGIPVLNYDRTGVGDSARPAAADVTLDTHAWVLHQLIDRLRQGTFGVVFRRIVSVGHSQGSAIILAEAAAQHDVDGLVVTGLVHVPEGPAGVASLLTSLYPAQTDPAYAAGDVPPGYLTTRPGTRAGIFYHQGDYEPAVAEIDEATKQLTTPAELATAPAAFAGQQDPAVPVLDVLGEYDALFCPPSGCARPVDPLSADPSFYPDPTKVTTFLLPGSGHDVNLHRNASAWFHRAAAWTVSLFPSRMGDR